MTCETYEALIALHIEGDLPANEADTVETHLALCARCRGFAADLRESQAAVKDLAEAEIDTAALATVRRKVQASLPAPERRRPFRFDIINTLMAAGLVATVVALFSGRPQPEAPKTTPVAAATRVSPRATVAPVVPAPPAVVASTASPTPRAPRRTAPVEPRLAPAPDAAHALAANAQASIVIKVETSNPDVVIYWLVDSNGGKS
jgi:anti-sigma factor RsiW